jgi:hypothetical protein
MVVIKNGVQHGRRMLSTKRVVATEKRKEFEKYKEYEEFKEAVRRAPARRIYQPSVTRGT